MDTPQARSVQSLQNLYSVVIGLALTAAILNVVDSTKGPVPLKLDVLPYFGSYLATLIPFYHGALRHLDATYLEGEGQETRSGALMGDFLVLFLESCFFFALAVLLVAPKLYAWGLIALLTLDTIWAFLAYVAFAKAHTEIKWASINLVTIILLCILAALLDALPPAAGPANARFAVVVLVVCIGRSVFDYGLNWHFYYPPKVTTQGKA